MKTAYFYKLSKNPGHSVVVYTGLDGTCNMVLTRWITMK